MAADLNFETAEQTAALIVAKYPNAKALAVKVDVSKEDQVKNLVHTAVEHFGRLDVMVR